jgi:hypothetical protein
MQTRSGQKPGREPGGPAGGGTLTYRRSSPGPGTSYVHGWSPPEPGVGSLSRKRYTQYVEQHRKGHCGNKSEDRKGAYNGGGAVS